MDETLKKAIQLMAEGKEEGFNKVYSETYNHVYFRAKGYMKNEEDALDLTQIVYVEAYKNIKSLQNPDALFGWLDGITLRQGMKLFRKKKDVLLSEDREGIFETLENEDVSVVPELTADQKATSEIVKGLIDELPELQRVALVAYYFDEMSVSQIAKLQECSEGTVKSRLNYARKYLKDRVEEKEKKEGYRIHVFTLPTLWYAIKMLAEETTLTAKAAQAVYGMSCAKVGLTATAITVSTATAQGAAISATAASSTSVAAGVADGTVKAAGIGAKFASFSTSMKAVVIAGSLAVATAVGGAVYIIALQPEAETEVVPETEVEFEEETAVIAEIVSIEDDLSECMSLCEHVVIDGNETSMSVLFATKTGMNEYTFYAEDIQKHFDNGEMISYQFHTTMPENATIATVMYDGVDIIDSYHEGIQGNFDGTERIEWFPFYIDTNRDVVVTITIIKDTTEVVDSLTTEEASQERAIEADLSQYIKIANGREEESICAERVDGNTYYFSESVVAEKAALNTKVCFLSDLPEGIYFKSVTYGTLEDSTTLVDLAEKLNENGYDKFFIKPSPEVPITVVVALEEGVQEENVVYEDVLVLSENEKMQIVNAIAWYTCMLYEDVESAGYVSSVRSYIQTILNGDGANALPLGWNSNVVTEETVKAFYEDGLGITIPDNYTYDDWGITCNSEMIGDAGADYFRYDSMEMMDNKDGTYSLSGTFAWGAEGEEDIYSFTATVEESGNPEVFGGLRLLSYESTE